jgi:hypothetical protein
VEVKSQTLGGKMTTVFDKPNLKTHTQILVISALEYEAKDQ